MITSLRAVIIAILTLQMPLFYMALQFGSPVEQALTAYGSGGKSWLYYLGRPATTFLGTLFGFFSDIHYAFRLTCFASLLLAIIFDSLSEAQIADRYECLGSGRCPQRGPWSLALLEGFAIRDLLCLGFSVWGLLLQGYLINLIGLLKPYYTYRQLTVGEFNRLLKLQEVYANCYEDIYEEYFGDLEEGDGVGASKGLHANAKGNRRQRKRSSARPVTGAGGASKVEEGQDVEPLPRKGISWAIAGDGEAAPTRDITVKVVKDDGESKGVRFALSKES
jgi:hypothetical protein